MKNVTRIDKLPKGAIKGFVEEYDSTSWRNVVIFPAAMTDEEALWASGMTPYYSGVGRGFASRPHVRRSRTRVLVSQRGGLDV